MLLRPLANSAGHFWWPAEFKNVANPDFGNLKHLQNPGHLSLTAPSKATLLNGTWLHLVIFSVSASPNRSISVVVTPSRSSSTFVIGSGITGVSTILVFSFHQTDFSCCVNCCWFVCRYTDASDSSIGWSWWLDYKSPPSDGKFHLEAVSLLLVEILCLG